MKLLFLFVLTCKLLLSSPLELAQEAEKNKNYKKAYIHYKKAAKREEEQALFKLGYFYYKGLISSKNYKKAKQYFEKASQLGHLEGFYYLGILHSDKKSGYLDYKKAIKIFKALASENYGPAQNRIAMFLTFGIGKIEKDFKKAVLWYEKASKQNFIPAQCNLAYMYASGKGVWTNFGRAHAFAKEGKEQGDKICLKVWKDFNLDKYKEDKGWKFNFYNKP